jgi:hypothetical protein
MRGHEAIENGKLKEEIRDPLLLDKRKTAVIGGLLFLYLAIIGWWAVTAKNSLDNILKNVLRDMARYSS